MNDSKNQSVKSETDSNWQPCADGTILGLVRCLRQRRRTQQIQKVVIAASCVLLVITVGNIWMSQPSTELTHDQVVKLAEDFIQGTLDPEQTRLVEEHIAVCPRCEHLTEDRRHYRQQQAVLILPDESVVALNESASDVLLSAR